MPRRKPPIPPNAARNTRASARVGDHYARVQPASRSQWRAWLELHHTGSQPVWLVLFKKAATDRPPDALTLDQAIDEALCFGWIDSLPRALDDARTMVLLSPRRPRSPWSRVNKAKVQRLIDAGLMTPAGLAKIDQAKDDGSWSVYDQAEDLDVPPDLADALRQSPDADEAFADFSPSSRKGILWWIASAKKPETRARRIADTVRLAAIGLRANFPESRGR